VDLADTDRRLRELVATIPPAFRSAVLAVLEAQDGADRARAIGDLHATRLMPETVELLIDAEEDAYVRAVLIGTLRETSRSTGGEGWRV
jgi:hypothetical protein